MTEQIPQTDTSLRVNVNLLDTLMTLAGELVLSRNQLLQGITSSNSKATQLSGQRIDMITSELQEAIMRTRMQPVGNILGKFTRIVRDLSLKLGKTIDLTLEGNEVELDKTILEGLTDPLTHLVRNAVDHGIETPKERIETGKAEAGIIKIRAFHDAGQVNILISDDGRGLEADTISEAAVAKGLVTEDQVRTMTKKQIMELILLPGFSTAEEMTQVSGRGDGMDVVTTNIEGLGGIVELDSTPGIGTEVQIKLPLTLAIIPSQITSVGEEKYAIPQVNLSELLRIPASQIKERIERVGDAEVVRLRGELLPILNLAKMLGIPRTFVDPETFETKPEKRVDIADRRAVQHLVHEDKVTVRVAAPSQAHLPREGQDRRKGKGHAINIAVVAAGGFKYGLVVDRFHDSEEIVVKPVGRHLKQCHVYAGATIMGDGKVALILDISNIAARAGLSSVCDSAQSVKAVEAKAAEGEDKAALLTFKNGETEYFAAPLNLVERIERIRSDKIETIGPSRVAQYRGGSLPLYELSQIGPFHPLPDREFQEVIVFKVKNREVGLMVTPPVDALEVVMDIDCSSLKQKAINGSMTIGSRTTLLLDIFEMVRLLNPDGFTRQDHLASEGLQAGIDDDLTQQDSKYL